MKKVCLICCLVAPFYVTSQTIDVISHFFEVTDQLMDRYVAGGAVDYTSLAKDKDLDRLIAFIQDFDHTSQPEAVEKAYLINTYNIIVIKGVVSHYPLNSLLKIFGFFDQVKWKIGSSSFTLDGLEKDYILKKFRDPRLHFAIACGAKGCPPLASFAYRPEEVEMQLNTRTAKVLNDPDFVRQSDGTVRISQIFNWYARDFGGSKKSMIRYVNQFRSASLDENANVSFYTYDWTLNDQLGPNSSATNASRYIVSSTVPKGGYELKWFNNLYSQMIPADRSRDAYFTSILNFVYGVAPRLNVGFDVRYRRFSAHQTPASAFKIFSFKDAIRSRSVLATIGPKIRFAPHVNWPNFSVQSALWFPVHNDLTGNDGEPWIDWDGPTWWTQFFNDFDVGTKFSLFAELDFFLEDIGSKSRNRVNRISTPITGIFSYFPNRKTTIYGLMNFSPYWSPEVDYFLQPGLGTKYQFTPQIELELLYTYFTNSFLQDNSGRAATFNLGLRISR